jgi:hypothetical protein
MLTETYRRLCVVGANSVRPQLRTMIRDYSLYMVPHGRTLFAPTMWLVIYDVLPHKCECEVTGTL